MTQNRNDKEDDVMEKQTGAAENDRETTARGDEPLCGIQIVLLEPEIPANTGNIGRTCVITGSPLHLIRPYGFILNEKMIKRAGMDYWDRLDLHEHIDYDAFERERDGGRIFYATTKGKNLYTDVEYHPGDYIMFGKESAGIPEEILFAYPERCVTIPMLPGERSLNLSNSVAIILYEALRQQGFTGLLHS